MTELSLTAASQIIDASHERARSLNLKPMTVAVLDAGGHLIAFKREDGSGILRPQIAVGKAWGCVGMGAGGRHLADRAASHPTFFTALTAASEGRVFPVAGGVLIRNAQGLILGAVGVSGDMPDQDEECAVCGIQAAGLQPDTGAAREKPHGQ
jgi:uncharacterized protein GlcG (DUF336 family)